MQQRQVLFDFDRPATFHRKSPPGGKSRVAEATSCLHPQPPASTLVRPIDKSCIPKPYSLRMARPGPTHDRDTITVDRIRDDIDGPSHRFVIRRGDTVEVFFSHQKTDIGEVTGISHRNNEVRVSFQEGTKGSGLAQVASIPLHPKSKLPVRKGVPLSKVVLSVVSSRQTASQTLIVSQRQLLLYLR